MSSRPLRYSDVATGLHWLIALLIISLLAIGKFMTDLGDDDPLRFTLTQWHKSFGITVLVLSVFRLVWRLTHKTPAHPADAAGWERTAASLSHLAFYVLMFAVPLTGWIMVSASPLDIKTYLFQVIPWPHLPPFASLPDKAEVAKAFHEYHELAGNLLIALLLVHVGAALKHRFVNHDDVLARMAPDWRSVRFRRLTQGVIAACVFAGSGLWLYASQTGSGSGPVQAGASNVSFIAVVSGSDTPGSFSESTVTLLLDPDSPSRGSLQAEVQTASFSTDNPQVSGSLKDADWFDVEQHPTASFESTAIESAGENAYTIDGDMTIKGQSESVTFEMTLEDVDGSQRATGEFPIDRLAFDVGAKSQPKGDTVGLEVIVRFDFEVSAGQT